ncbi:amidase [Microbacterium sp. SSW1-59]|uniref:amidase n=1 Tax=Microbacterium xanthum TaxID=3079794 RepID=UPI002AD3651C|nr:amidase [Microbacterium sp. SSW1-59]MDZ8200920.1 amidase [Microbacterium sp. SSW1-59]
MINDGSYFSPGGQFTLTEVDDGPLRGVTVAVKDLYDVAGRVTGAGNPALTFEGSAARSHAVAVSRLLSAGATVMGKTATDELAAGMFGVNSHFGTPWNPAALDRVPGGSSSGAASAVAAGDAALGLGTDTGGSVRTPASFCGLFGLRTTHGRIPLDGVRPMAPSFDTVSLLARRTDVIGAALEALVDAAAPPRRISRLVIAEDLLALADPDTVELVRRTAARWSRLWGFDLEARRVCPAGVTPADLVDTFWPLMSRQLWESNGAWVRTEDPPLGEGIRDRILAAGQVDDVQIAAADAGRRALSHALSEHLEHALLVLPTAVGPAPLRTASFDDLMDYRARNLPLVVPASLCGMPQLSVPTGIVEGAPVGVSMLGMPGDDEELLRWAARRGAA